MTQKLNEQQVKQIQNQAFNAQKAIMGPSLVMQVALAALALTTTSRLHRQLAIAGMVVTALVQTSIPLLSGKLTEKALKKGEKATEVPHWAIKVGLLSSALAVAYKISGFEQLSRVLGAFGVGAASALAGGFLSNAIVNRTWPEPEIEWGVVVKS